MQACIAPTGLRPQWASVALPKGEGGFGDLTGALGGPGRASCQIFPLLFAVSLWDCGAARPSLTSPVAATHMWVFQVKLFKGKSNLNWVPQSHILISSAQDPRVGSGHRVGWHR